MQSHIGAAWEAAGCVSEGERYQLRELLQGYLAHKNAPPPKTLQQAYA